jgi:choline dehydrogenase-like flavoprotein
MNKMLKENEFDAIIIGSGTGGATIARELSKQNKKILILEQGADNLLKESFLVMGSISQEIPVAKNMKAMRAITTGGSTALYFAVCMTPPIDTLLSLGIDISKEYEEVKKELQIAELPDELMAPQTKRFIESANGLGYSLNKNQMLIDQSKCTSGFYSYEAKWKAKSYVHEAIKNGATLINLAKVTNIVIEKNKAIGVEYTLKSKICQAYGTNIILAAGSLSTPQILQNCGVKGIGKHGFFVKPGIVIGGIVPGLKGKDSFLGSIGVDLGDGIMVGDGNMSNTLFKMFMLAQFKMMRVFSHATTLTTGVTVEDSRSGELKDDGRYFKQLTDNDYKKVKKGEDAAIKILKNAGAKDIFKSGFSAGNPEGVIRIQEDLDDKLQTKIGNLYVCDASLVPEIKTTPTLTLLCLGKYLAKHLLSAL